jgi:hypothetical protein
MAIYRPRCGIQLHVVFDGRGGPNKEFTIDHVRPRSCTVSRNGYHEADTWNATFDLRVFPFDPEGIASMFARIYMWDDRFGPGYEWAVDDNEMVRGIADEDTIKIDKSQNEFRVSGRDYTAILDPEWDPRKQVPAGIPLVEAVQQIADSAAPESSSARFEVVWDVKDDDGTPLPPTEFLSNGSARSTKKKGMWVKQGKTTWDVIYDLVIQNGFIVFVKGSQIVITTPRTQTSSELLAAATLVHGRNLKSLEAGRKLAKERVPRIRIVYWDAGGRRQFDVVYPEKDQKLAIGLGLKKNEDLILPAPTYCHDAESALRFAKMRWELMARAETVYKFETRHLRAPRGDGSNFLAKKAASFLGIDDGFDLLRMQAGDPIALRFDPFNGEAMRALDSGQREEFLLSLGYHPRVAAFVAENYERLTQITQAYYTRVITYDYSHDQGLTISGEGVNFAYERREIQWSNGDIKADTISGAG